MLRNGQPMIVVLDGDRTNRARDFVTLQNNSKLQTTQPNGRPVQEHRRGAQQGVAREGHQGRRRPALRRRQEGRVLTDSPGKLSAKIASYKAIRYTSGTLLVGTGYRTTKSWADQVSLAMARADSGESDPTNELVEFWRGYSQLPAVANALRTEKGIALLREDTWLTSAYLLYALAAAVHDLTRKELTIPEAFAVLNDFDFSRAGTGLHNTLVEPPTEESGPRGRTGRDAWEGAAQVLVEFAGDRVSPAA